MSKKSLLESIFEFIEAKPRTSTEIKKVFAKQGHTQDTIRSRFNELRRSGCVRIKADGKDPIFEIVSDTTIDNFLETRRAKYKDKKLTVTESPKKSKFEVLTDKQAQKLNDIEPNFVSSARYCQHTREGYQVVSSSGLRFRWCAKCGSIGVFTPGKVGLGWVQPGAIAEEMLMDFVSKARQQSALEAALPS